jgi:pimeloyl-ACP methyl ester carboxylesterase
MAFASVNRCELWFEEKGRAVAGRPGLLLVHGFPLDSRIWADQMDDLAICTRVIAPDLRGFGKSKCDQPFTMETLADDLHGVIGQLKLGPCVLAGLSMGGYASLALARKYPGDVTGLILVDSRTDADSAAARESRGQMIELARTKGATAIAEAMLPRLLSPAALAHRPAVVQKLKAITRDCPALTSQHALAAMRDRMDQAEWLAGAKIPVRFIVGEEDAISPPQLAKEVVRRIGRGDVTVIANAGHLAPLEQPALTSRAMVGFLRKA